MQAEHVSEDLQSREVLDNGESHFGFNNDVVIANHCFCKEEKGNGSGKYEKAMYGLRMKV